MSGSGRRIRTLTNRVRVCRATLTQSRCVDDLSRRHESYYSRHARLVNPLFSENPGLSARGPRLNAGQALPARGVYPDGARRPGSAGEERYGGGRSVCLPFNTDLPGSGGSEIFFVRFRRIKPENTAAGTDTGGSGPEGKREKTILTNTPMGYILRSAYREGVFL